MAKVENSTLAKVEGVIASVLCRGLGTRGGAAWPLRAGNRCYQKGSAGLTAQFWVCPLNTLRAEDSTHERTVFLTLLLIPNVSCLFQCYFSNSLAPAGHPTFQFSPNTIYLESASTPKVKYGLSPARLPTFHMLVASPSSGSVIC